MTALARRAALRRAIDPARPILAMAAHSPLSAKLAAEAGFPAIWGGGFELAANYAVPDANILPMGVHLELMRAICATVEIPVIADLDTGFGNAVNVAYNIPQYIAAGVAGVIIEDKTFPKDSSLREDARQALVPIEEYLGKIAAARSVSAGSDLLIIGRTEALIADLGQEEALKRATAYAEAGVDAVLVHSKRKTPEEILEFCRAWPGKVPLVFVPTAYPQLSVADIAALGKVGLLIFANHAVRAATAAMRRVFAKIIAEQGIAGVEGEIATTAAIFDLQGDALMREYEERFLK